MTIPSHFHPPLFGWPAFYAREFRTWRLFCVFGRPVSWILWRYMPRPRNLLHRCEVCGRRFRPWERPTMIDTEPIVHRACETDPSGGGYIPKRYQAALSAAIERMRAQS